MSTGGDESVDRLWTGSKDPGDGVTFSTPSGTTPRSPGDHGGQHRAAPHGLWAGQMTGHPQSTAPVITISVLTS